MNSITRPSQPCTTENHNQNQEINCDQNQDEESYLKDIIYLTLLRQKIDGSVFDADFYCQDQRDIVDGQQQQLPSSKLAPDNKNNKKPQVSIKSKSSNRVGSVIAATTTIRVHIPELKAEIEIDCRPHDSFWHLKLCLINSLLNSGRGTTGATDGEQPASSSVKRASQCNSLAGQLILSSRPSGSFSTGGRRSSLASRAKNVISRRLTQTPRCYSSGGSISSADASTCSTGNATTGLSFSLTGGSRTTPPPLLLPLISKGIAADNLSQRSAASSLYYGFSAFGNLSPWDDNARHSSDFTEDEEAAVNALLMATESTNADGEDRELDEDDDDVGQVELCVNEEEEGDYASLALTSTSDQRISTTLVNNYDHDTNNEENFHHVDDYLTTNYNDNNINFNVNFNQHKSNATGNRLFEQALKSGYLNYGFYSFSLAKFVDDQTHLTDYLSLVSSSSGGTYYLDLEFKLKQRQQTQLASAYLAPPSSVGAKCTKLNVISNNRAPQSNNHHQRLSLVSNSHPTSNSQDNNLLKSSSLNYYQSQSSLMRQTSSGNQSFANNMIAKLSATGSQSQHQPAQSSAQSKRKRSKLLDMLLNTNWSKQSQQSSNLMKLNKLLLVCDANFLDEKSGESPLSLAICSPQINITQSNGSQILPLGASYTQSASLFNLQCQSSVGLNQSMLQQTNITDLSQSRAPLIERLLLLLIKSGALIDFRNSDGRTPLHVAAMKSNFWALKTLLDLGASTDYRDINGLTPLYYSILHKADLKVTQLLLNNSRNPSGGAASISNAITRQDQQVDRSTSQTIGIIDQHGWQEVHQACKLGLDAHLEKLLYYGCDINAKISGSGNTPLHVAAINDQLDCAKVLLMRGADKTITNSSHQTAHQVAVISNNMDLAEFIAEHTESEVVPFRERPANFADLSRRSTLGCSIARSSLLTNSRSSASLAKIQQDSQRSNMQPQPQPMWLPQQHNLTKTIMHPLELDVAQVCTAGNTPQPLTSSQPQSLLSMSSSQLNVQVNNVSPCLSQRSCATSNTTSSSGVCCDGDGNNSAEELQQQQQKQQAAKFVNSHSQHSNITIISIGNKANEFTQESGPDEDQAGTGEEEEEDLRSSGSSSNGLYSLMSAERPLFAGTIVEATSEYQSGDPNHLQLRRGDLVEVLECTQELLQAGQLPRLANKPMLFGRRQSDGLSGLFPSFCVQRTKQRQPGQMRQTLSIMEDKNSNSSVANTIHHQQQGRPINDSIHMQIETLGQLFARDKNLPDSQSMVAVDKQQQQQQHQQQQEIPIRKSEHLLKLKFKELHVTLKKTNEGFGFVLRGGKVDPATLDTDNCKTNKVIIDERLMAANNLLSLQYLDEIEPASVAHQAGLKRGDFLVAVNQHDVRLSSHEHVVQMIRQSGDQVHLTIATPITTQMTLSNQPTYMSGGNKTLGRVKPEPPKRDPTTTLSRNRTQKVKSMFIQPQQQQLSEHFDANKPLPLAPDLSMSSPTGSLNMIGRSISTNLTHFHSAQSLSSAIDTQSISSVSTISADQQDHQQQQSQQTTPTHSSSSTATLTTVAVMKPKTPPKLSRGQSSAIYQPAMITTTKRVSQPNLSPSLPKVSLSTAPGTSSTQTVMATPSPPSPPPPPPLPDFSAGPQTDRLSQRRTSLPIYNQSATINIDSNRSQKKREILAAVSQVGPSATPAPTQFGAVAAACAAAANNRMQRQQQQQQQLPEVVRQNDRPSSTSEVEQSTVNEMKPDQAEEKPEEVKVEERPEVANLEKQILITRQEETIRKEPNVLVNELTKHASYQHSSATLGRKSSAQIIQQPKQQQQQQYSQSQSLKVRPKRAAIPSYDELPPPPPPLLDEPDTRQYEQQPAPIAPVYEHHSHHNRCNNHIEQQQLICQPAEVVSSNKQSHEFSQQQPLTLQQQQITKQQLRQQQLLQHQQQQLKLQQQMQLQQRLCLSGKHGHEHQHSSGHHYNSSIAKGHNIHEQHPPQQMVQQHQIVAVKAHSHSHHHHLHNHQHHRHNHHHSQLQPHHHNHEPVTTAATQQQPQYHHHHHHHHQASIHSQPELQQQSQAATLLNHSHHHVANQQQQQQLYQRLQQQQFIERYLPLVYSNDPYAPTTRDS